MFHRLLLCRNGSLRSPYSMHSSIAWCGVSFRLRGAFGLSAPRLRPRLGVRCAPPRLWRFGGWSPALSLLCARPSCSGVGRRSLCSLSLRVAFHLPRQCVNRIHLSVRPLASRGCAAFYAPLSPRVARSLVDICPLGWLVSGGRVASSHAPPIWLVSGIAC